MDTTTPTRILEILAAAKCPVSTLELEKSLGKQTAKDINPDLYRLLGQKLVVKTSNPNGSNPRWSISSRSDQESRIIATLKEQKEPILLKDLVSKLADVPRKDVNSILYALEKKKLAIKTADEDGKNPHWALVQSQD